MNLIIIFLAKYVVFILPLGALVFFLSQPRETQKVMVTWALVLAPSLAIATFIAKHVYYNPRPFVVGNFTPLIAHGNDNGFPSDHTMLGMAITTLLYPFSKKWGVTAFILTVLVGLGRVLAGVHHLLDIGGSIIIAIVVAILSYMFIFKKIPALGSKKTA